MFKTYIVFDTYTGRDLFHVPFAWIAEILCRNRPWDYERE